MIGTWLSFIRPRAQRVSFGSWGSGTLRLNSMNAPGWFWFLLMPVMALLATLCVPPDLARLACAPVPPAASVDGGGSGGAGGSGKQPTQRRRARIGLATVLHYTLVYYLVFLAFIVLEVSTRILGRRTVPFPPFRIPCRVTHGVPPRS